MSSGRRVSGDDRAKFAVETAAHLRAILGALDRGELTATATTRARIEGAVVAFDAVAADDPAVALAAVRESLKD